ncbi:MAG: NERD domain-containing protein [Spirochaetota bacterium]|nr:NERD domain-containing protein [Spirochaetota bacterium]
MKEQRAREGVRRSWLARYRKISFNTGWKNMGTIIILFALALFFFLRLKYKSPEYKGSIGEARVARRISDLPEQEFTVLNNIYLETERSSSQIDHVIVSIYGIFVIETKNYSGWIFGNENQEYWTQTIYNYKNKFRNPIKQNWAHIYALKELLTDYKFIKYYPIIVFTGTAKLKKITSKIPVVYNYELLQTIQSYCEEPILSPSQTNDIVDIITANNIHDEGIHKKHKQNIYNDKYELEQKINSLICPKCSGQLVLRNGSYGRFYGCSNYPQCKFTRNIE